MALIPGDPGLGPEFGISFRCNEDQFVLSAGRRNKLWIARHLFAAYGFDPEDILVAPHALGFHSFIAFFSSQYSSKSSGYNPFSSQTAHHAPSGKSE